MPRIIKKVNFTEIWLLSKSDFNKSDVKYMKIRLSKKDTNTVTLFMIYMCLLTHSTTKSSTSLNNRNFEVLINVNPI